MISCENKAEMGNCNFKQPEQEEAPSKQVIDQDIFKNCKIANFHSFSLTSGDFNNELRLALRYWERWIRKSEND